MKEKELLTVHAAPPAGQPTEQHRRDERLMQQARESITTRLESFGQEFDRLAETAGQGVQAERFRMAVRHLAESGPLTAADFSGPTDFPGWLKMHGDRFEELATTPAQKELVASFREFTREAGSEAVKETFQRPLVNELVEDIKAWMQGSSNGVPFDSLPPEGKKELLSLGIDWTDYINRGLAVETGETWMGIDVIIDNAVAGKSAEQWMEGAQGPGPKDGTPGALRDQLFAPTPPQPQPEHPRERQRKR
jgi:hypothetical protein